MTNPKRKINPVKHSLRQASGSAAHTITLAWPSRLNLANFSLIWQGQRAVPPKSDLRFSMHARRKFSRARLLYVASPCRRCGVGSVPWLLRLFFLAMMGIAHLVQGSVRGVNRRLGPAPRLPLLARIIFLVTMVGFAEAQYFSVSGPCTVSGPCLYSRNFPGTYLDNEQCSFTPYSTTVGMVLNTFSFQTESCCDKLTVNGVQYQGNIGPSNVVLGSGAITWYTDSSVVYSGFQVCVSGLSLIHI